jgi:sodium/hydrogen antiporter
MYENAAMLAAFLLIYSAVAGRIERSWTSGPIVFTGVGFIIGLDGLGVLRINIGGEGLRFLAELTLAMVLFTDAANADFSIVKRNLRLPERLLLIGPPLTILLGFLFAAIVFPSLETLELALLAAMLVPTDAALGKPVVTNRTVPPVMREALNLESGLNDGICVPIVVLLLGVTGAGGGRADRGRDDRTRNPRSHRSNRSRGGDRTRSDLVHQVHAAICEKRGWISEQGVEIPIVALAAGAAGGSGFIACFVGVLLLSGLRERHKEGAAARSRAHRRRRWRC